MLQGKTAIVTGGTRGIGLAIVRTFLKNGANVALFGSRSETVGKALKELKEENPNWPVIGMAPDIAKYDEMKAAVDEVRRAGHNGKQRRHFRAGAALRLYAGKLSTHNGS